MVKVAQSQKLLESHKYSTQIKRSWKWLFSEFPTTFSFEVNYAELLIIMCVCKYYVPMLPVPYYSIEPEWKSVSRGNRHVTPFTTPYIVKRNTTVSQSAETTHLRKTFSIWFRFIHRTITVKTLSKGYSNIHMFINSDF